MPGLCRRLLYLLLLLLLQCTLPGSPPCRGILLAQPFPLGCLSGSTILQQGKLLFNVLVQQTSAVRCTCLHSILQGESAGQAHLCEPGSLHIAALLLAGRRRGPRSLHCRCGGCLLTLGISAPLLRHTEPLLRVLRVLPWLLLPQQWLPLLVPAGLVVVIRGSALPACRCKAPPGLRPHQPSRWQSRLLLLRLPAVAAVLLRQLCCWLLLLLLPRPVRCSKGSGRQGGRRPCAPGHALPLL